MKKGLTEGFIAAVIVFLGLILLSFSFDGQNLKTDNTTPNEQSSLDKHSVKETKQSNRVERTSDRASAINSTHSHETMRFAERSINSKAERMHLNNRRDYRIATREILDSINRTVKISFKEGEEVPEEVEQLIDIAYTCNDVDLANLIKESINVIRVEIKIDSVMEEVSAALEEANINEEVLKELEKAREELIIEIGDSNVIAVEALELASDALESIDINVDISEIVSISLEHAMEALESIDMEEVGKAMEEVGAAMENVEKVIEEIDVEQIIEDVILEASEVHEIAIEVQEDMEELEVDEDNDNKARSRKEKRMEEKLKELEK